MASPFVRCLGLSCTLASAAAQSGWQQMQPTQVPPARGWAHVTYDMWRNVTVVFGGDGFNSQRLSDTWEWNGTDWAARPTALTPPARLGGALGYDLFRGRAVLFGGSAGSSGDLSDTWEYDGSNWAQVATSGPSVRRFPAMAFDLSTGRMILFGGLTALPVIAFRDTWAWNGIAWQQLAPAHAPLGRWSHSMVTDLGRGKIVLHGGTADFNSMVAMADTWLWDGSDWSRVSTVTSPGQVDFGMAFDLRAGVAVMFGGYPARNATWLFLGDTWIPHPTLPLPSARSGCSLAFDAANGTTVLFGGFSPFFARLADTWVYRAPAIGRWSPVGSGCAGSAGVPSLRPIARTRPVVGTVFPLEVTNVADGLVAFATGFSTSVWQGRPLPAPVDAIGMPGCTLYTSVDVVDFATAVGGRATVTLAVPATPALAGLEFANQAISFEATANAFGAVLANAGFGILGGI